MKLRTRITALSMAAALALSLTACSNLAGNPVLPGSSDVPPVPDLTSDDVCLATAGIPGDTTMFTVNGSAVTAQEYLYWLAYGISYLESYMSYFGGTGIDWDTDIDETTTQSDYLKQDAYESALYWKLISLKAAELGCTLTDEEIAQLNASIEVLKTQYGGQEDFEEALRLSCLTEETLFQLNATPLLSSKLASALFADQLTDEVMDDYIAEEDLLYAKHILLLTVDPNTRVPLDEETIAAKSATAQDLLAQLRESGDPLTLFDELMVSCSEDSGLAQNPDGYTFTAGQMVSEFEEATRALEFGQISDIVESDYGYHIILRLDPDTETNRQTYLATQLNDQLQSWAYEAVVEYTQTYNDLDAQVFYENLTALSDGPQNHAEPEGAENTAEPDSGT